MVSQFQHVFHASDRLGQQRGAAELYLLRNGQGLWCIIVSAIVSFWNLNVNYLNIFDKFPRHDAGGEPPGVGRTGVCDHDRKAYLRRSCRDVLTTAMRLTMFGISVVYTLGGEFHV